MSDPTVVVERDGGVGIVRLNRPEVLNALDPATMRLLGAAFAELAADDAVRALLLTGEGRSFCAGGDQAPGAQPDRDAFGWYDYLATEIAGLVRGLVRFPKPAVAAVHGHAYGAGMCIAMACDLVVAARDARFAMVQTRIGNKPDFGGLYLLPRRVASLSIAKDLVLTAREVGAEEALRIGLANRLADGDGPAAAGPAGLALARELAAGPTLSLRMSKSILDRSAELDLDAVLELEALAHGYVKQSADHREGVAAFRERRPPRFTGEQA